jgi:hypothetical protein
MFHSLEVNFKRGFKRLKSQPRRMQLHVLPVGMDHTFIKDGSKIRFEEDFLTW